MVKKVVIAAAGRGTRMLHLTDNKPKHLLEISGKPFLSYVLDNLLLAGYKEIVLVAGYKEELVRDFLKTYKSPNGSDFKIDFVNQYEKVDPDQRYGTAIALECAKDYVGQEQFLFVCGDNLYAVEDLRAMNIDDNYSYIAGLIHETPEKYGVLINGGEFLKGIIEKPKEYVGNLINAGMYKFTPEVFEKLPLIEKSARGEYEITDVITLLAKEQKVKTIKIKEYWKDLGNPDDIGKLNKFIENEKVASK